MLSYSLPGSRLLPGLAVLCLLSLLLGTALRTCDRAQNQELSHRLPAVTSVPAPKPPSGKIDPTLPVVALAKAPEHVRKVIQHLRANAPQWSNLKNYKGGRIFRNLEGRLPAATTYREYDVRPLVKGVPRGAERLVVDAGRRNFYYTTDHYGTFTKIRLP